MCAVSFIMDWGIDKLNRLNSILEESKYYSMASSDIVVNKALEGAQVSYEKIYTINTLEELIPLAKEYDEKTGQPDCELEEKKNQLLKLAEGYGLSI